MRVHIDRGGTFTDVVRVDAEGRAVIAKVPSDEAVIGRLVGPDDSLALGTTVATNALLERRGVKTLLVVTAGFEDLVQLRDMARPDLFDPDRDPPPTLASAVIGMAGSASTIVRGSAEADRLVAAANEVAAVAIVLLGGGDDPSGEVALAELIRARCPHAPYLALGHTISRDKGYLARIETCLVDAAVTPLLARSLADDAIPLDALAMRSDGSLVPASELRAHEAVLSGPAGGVLATLVTARAAGFTRAVGLDMGGTSTDVCLVDDAQGLPLREGDLEVAGVRLRRPMLEVETIAAGGGSILGSDVVGLSVGPRSAGADPGPQCYGRGGPPTLTDAALVAGLIDPAAFPFPLHPDRVALPGPTLHPSPGLAIFAKAFLAIARESMAQAVRRLAMARGIDLTDHALIAYGGAGGQHACAVAALLGIKTVLVHPAAAVFCAFGQSLARRSETSRISLWGPLELLAPELPQRFAELTAALPTGPAWLAPECFVVVRSVGTDHPFELPWSPSLTHTELAAAFAVAHVGRYGFARPAALELVSLVARVYARPTAAPTLAADPFALGDSTIAGPTVLHGGATSVEVPAGWTARVDRGPRKDGEASPAGLWTEGLRQDSEASPAGLWTEGLRQDGEASPAGLWTEGLRQDGEAWTEGLLRLDHAPATTAASSEPTLLTGSLELWQNRLRAIAVEAGVVLSRLARSVSIKERLDFSCAIFDGAGRLITNAPHIPVHLGAMGDTVRDLVAAIDHGAWDSPTQPASGDAWLSNDPLAGGSHLPDLTVISLILESGHRFFVASRGHHVDVGGLTPGSMPVASRTLADEGMRFSRVPLVAAAVLTDLPALVAGSRQPDVVAADLEAQLAANAHMARRLHELDPAALTSALAALHDRARDATAALIAALPADALVAHDELAGIPLHLRLSREGARLRVDFSGTGGPHPGNLNAPPAVVRASVLYALRLVLGGATPQSFPLNDGTLAVVDIIVPQPSIISPPPDAAIVGGNVETSQRIVDLFLRALDRRASSAGTMNNLVLGRAANDPDPTEWAFYETLGAGFGATSETHGRSARQLHMTNTRATDPEILAARLPVRVRRFAIRHGSGGIGLHAGGDGLVRELEVLRPTTASLLAAWRPAGAAGLHGGGAGAPGRAFVARAGANAPKPWDGRTVVLAPGDRVIVETPGGGAWGTDPDLAADPSLDLEASLLSEHDP